MKSNMEYEIDQKSIQILQEVFSVPQQWDGSPERQNSRYDVFFPGIGYRQSLWGLGARLKIRRVGNPEIWDRGGLLKIKNRGNSDQQKSKWNQWVSLLLYPLPHDFAGPLVSLGKPRSFWGKSHPGMRSVSVPDDGHTVCIWLPGTSGRCWRDLVIGPCGTHIVRHAAGMRSILPDTDVVL